MAPATVLLRIQVFWESHRVGQMVLGGLKDGDDFIINSDIVKR